MSPIEKTSSHTSSPHRIDERESPKSYSEHLYLDVLTQKQTHENLNHKHNPQHTKLNIRMQYANTE